MSKGLVTIALAVYNPNLTWLKQQMESINNQTYEQIEVLVCNDCSTSISPDDLVHETSQYVSNYPIRFIHNEVNQGSNRTFEILTECATGEFIAYSDQDDIWEAEKIERLISAFQDDNVTLAYSDMSIINSEGEWIAKSITQVRKNFKYFEGQELWRNILIRNFISGCCMIVKTGIAKASIPFEPGMHHDRWIAIVASSKGDISFIKDPLVRYRQHGENQTGILKGVYNKRTYYEIRLVKHIEMLRSIKSRFKGNLQVESFLDAYLEQMDTRVKYAKGIVKSLPKMIAYVKENRSTILFELFCLRLPDFVFKKAIKMVQSMNS